MIRGLHKNSRRGSTFIIVVGILSVLVLIATALSFSTRMDLISSSNFADGVQQRTAAVSGVARALELLSEELRYTSLLQEWANSDARHVFSPLPLTRTDIQKGVVSSRYVEPPPEDITLYVPEPLANLAIRDECSKVNVNTASEEVIAKTFRAIINTLPERETPLDIEYMARRITTLRFGEDGKPGRAYVDDNADRADTNVLSDGIDQDFDGEADNKEELIYSPLWNGIDNDLNGVIDNTGEGAERDGIDNDLDGSIDEAGEGVDDGNEYVADIRLPAFGDDQRWHTLSELKSTIDIPDDIYREIAPYFTTFSSSKEIYFIGSKVYPKLNINNASVQEMYDALRDFFPEKNDRLLQQFAVNIADVRDTDNIPLVFPGSDIEKPVIGIELTPYIIEIYADSLTDSSDGDDGQYLELYNPYPFSIDVDGWQLVTGSSYVSLEGDIAAEGFLIITDDYNEINDIEPEDEQPGYGSFYDIFDVVPNKSTKRLIEDPLFDLPDNEGIVYLRDGEGNLIDYQAYEGGVYTGVSRSFQRKDPRVRLVYQSRPQPFTEPESEGTLRLSFEEISEFYNRLFASPGLIMYLSSGFFDPESEDGQVWQEPSLNISKDSDKIDSRVIDLFTVASVAQPHLSTEVLRTINPQNEAYLTSQLKENLHSIQSPSIIGKINVNTASSYVLQSLPGMTEEIAQNIVQYRYNLSEEYLKDIESEGSVLLSSLTPLKTISDVLRHDRIWGDGYDELERLALFNQWANYITTNSRSFSVIAQSAPVRPLKNTRCAHPISIFALLSLDQVDSPVIYFKYLNQ